MMAAFKYIIALLVFGITSASAQYATKLTVALDGSADYTSIQAAIDDAKSFPDEGITIFVKAGIYQEKVTVHAWNTRITLKGEGAHNTIIRWDDSFDSMDRGRNSTFHTATLLVRGDQFRAEDLTIENSAGEVGQAVALAVEADRCQFHRCRMIGNQDTLYADGSNARHLYSKCYIEGTTDFIFGGATAVFEACTIHSKRNSFITAASTPPGRKFGFVFLDCTLTADEGVNAVYLGRPWRDYAKTAFLNCEFGDHILPAGWDNWSSPHREKTTFYAEYQNRGPGADMAGRVSWCYKLSNAQARDYRTNVVLNSVILPEMKLTD
jgi:pectinesterase